MAKWSVALFGYLVDRYYIVEKTTQVYAAEYRAEPLWNDKDKQWEIDGDVYPESVYSVIYNENWEKRCYPGDIAAWKPFDRAHTWTTGERKTHLIISIDGITNDQMNGLGEIYWDTNSYYAYNPQTYEVWYAMMQAKVALAKDPIKTAAALEVGKVALYDSYIEGQKERASYPRGVLKKRRFNIPLPDLTLLGVDTGRMLDVDDQYEPKVDTVRTQFYDKFNSRYVLPGDGLNIIAPVYQFGN